MKQRKKIKLNIFWKTFLITTAMLTGITFIAFTLIYILLPDFYQNHKISTYNELVRSRVFELANTNHLDDEITILNTIFQGSNASFILFDNEAVVLYQLELIHQTNVTQTIPEEFLDNSPNDGLTTIVSDFEDTFLSLTFDYTTNSGYNRTLEVSIPLSPLADAQVVIMSMYPFAILLSIAFALIAAFIFSRWIAKPIKQIQAATSKMSLLEPNVTTATKSQDEIGTLSQDISQLYAQLHGTIITLEQEISRYSDAENKKIEFLQSVSHEMKNPLASANALLEGIIYEVPPYHDNPKKYLKECREFLQRTIQLTKESLNLSEQYKKPAALYDLADIIKETSNLYGVIFMVKQLSYHEYVPGNISIHTKKHLLSKVLSNLFSNAANYTTEGGQVRVSFNDAVLTVFNSCKPLSQAQVDEIWGPLMTQNTSEHATGLGLFIVKQLLRQLKIEFEFAASADGTGMEFKLWLPIVEN